MTVLNIICMCCWIGLAIYSYLENEDFLLVFHSSMWAADFAYILINDGLAIPTTINLIVSSAFIVAGLYASYNFIFNENINKHFRWYGYLDAFFAGWYITNTGLILIGK